jgi:hypothetical protein
LVGGLHRQPALSRTFGNLAKPVCCPPGRGFPSLALMFLEIRVIMGLFGLDQPFDWHITETVVWSYVAVSVLLGDIANQMYELRTLRHKTVRVQAAQPVAVPATGT